ncbi:MAG: hypothetical protein OXI01_20395 [Albidovulum sp.]|nr:hypothetical protein [Albidovulum sp.]
MPGKAILGLAEAAVGAGVADIQVLPGRTLSNAVFKVARGSTDVAAAPLALPIPLSRGAGSYSATGAEDGANLAGNLRVLYTNRLALFGLGAFECANFGGYDAVEGSTVYNGPPRKAALNRARAMIRLAAGLDEGNGYEGVQVGWGQGLGVAGIAARSIGSCAVSCFERSGATRQEITVGAGDIFQSRSCHSADPKGGDRPFARHCGGAAALILIEGFGKKAKGAQSK